jgi:GTP cyclohydrolase II
MRIKGDLRLGLPVALLDGHYTALVAWVETLTEDRLAALTSIGPLELALTRRRAEALGLSVPCDGSDILRLDIPAGADLNWLHGLTGQGVDAAGRAAGSLPAMRPAMPLHEAALALAKSGQVLPAALVVPVQDAGAEAMRLGLMPMRVSDIMDELKYDHPQHCVSSANLPMDASKAGRVHVFRPEDGGVEHYAIEIGNPDLRQPVTVRLHSACFTGDVLGSLKCDCGAQLRAAMNAMASGRGGVVLYLNQEGRGIGLANKMRAYALQDAGLDTVEANHWLGFNDDERDFRTGGNLLHWLGIARVRLMTNNPAKIAILASQGIDVVERVPLKVGGNDCNAGYLATKAAKSGHLLT